MRIFSLSLALLCHFPVTGFAQQTSSDAITADQKDVGKVQTRILKYDQGLGVVVQLARPHGANVECNAVCYLPSSSKAITGKCDPARKCDLQCTVNPPVGGCN